MRIALDTNILAYAEGVNGPVMQATALDVVERLPRDLVLIPVQTLGELYNVLVRKARLTPEDAREAIQTWHDSYSLIETSPAVMRSAVELATDHQLSIWDAVVVAAAAATGCRLLLSQDLQDGFTWNGVTITNPLLPVKHPLLDAVMSVSGSA